VEGVIHTVFDSDGDECSEWTKVKQVPANRIVAAFDGTWRGRIRWKRVGEGSYPAPADQPHGGVTRSTASSPNPSHVKLPRPTLKAASASRADVGGADGEWSTLLDLSVLGVIPKRVRPLEKQDERESRKLWENVTGNLLRKEYGEATKEKVAIEQKQRDEAAERKKANIEWVFIYSGFLSVLMSAQIYTQIFRKGYVARIRSFDRRGTWSGRGRATGGIGCMHRGHRR